jgi:hypothetical protein
MLNYSTIANLHTLQITVTFSTCQLLVTDLNSGDSSTAATKPLFTDSYTILNSFVSCSPYNSLARTASKTPPPAVPPLCVWIGCRRHVYRAVSSQWSQRGPQKTPLSTVPLLLHADSLTWEPVGLRSLPSNGSTRYIAPSLRLFRGLCL